MRKLVYLIVAIVALGLIVSGCIPVVPPTEKGGPNPELGPPTLEKITFIHYVKDGNRSKPEWDDTVDKYKLMFGGIKWEDTIEYKVNPEGSNLDPEVVRSTLQASLETWNTAITSSVGLPFKLFETPELGSVSYNEYRDGINTVTWRILPWENAIAMCAFWFYPNTKEIIESDVVFNTYYDWSLTGATGTMDLQNIATHEFGHNGLNDLYMPPSQALTMYGYSSLGDTDKQSLGTGDVSGIQKLYGE